MCFYFTLNFSIYLELSSVSAGIETCPSRICCEIIQFQIEIRKISRCGLRSPDNAEFGHFTLLFCKGRDRNVRRTIMHVHSHCFANQTLCLVTFSLPLPSSLRKVPNFVLCDGNFFFCLSFQTVSH